MMLPGNDAGDRSPVSHFTTVLLAITVGWIAATPALSALELRVADFIPRIDFARAGFLVVIAMLLVRIAREPLLFRRFNGVEKALAVYLLVIAASWISTFGTKDVVTLKEDANFLLTCFVMPLAAYWVARTTAWTPARIASCLWALILILAIPLIAFGLAQGVYDWSFLVEESAKMVHRDRAKGPFANAVLFGMVVACLIPVSCFLYLQARSRAARFAALCLGAGLVEVVVLSKARGVWIAVVTALIFAAAKRPRLRWPAAAVILAILAQIGLASMRSPTPAPQAARSSRTGSMRERVTEIASIYNRVAVYATDLNMIAARPLLGFGFGLSTFEQHRVDYYTSCCGVPVRYATECVVPHNEILNVLILIGAVGLLVYLAVVWQIWRLLAAAGGSVDSTRAALALTAQMIFVTLVLVGQVHDLMYVGYVTLLFLFVLGMIAGTDESEHGRQVSAAGRGAVQSWIGSSDVRNRTPDTPNPSIRVLFLVHDLDVGGAERAVYNLAVGVQALGCKPVVCAWHHGGLLETDFRDSGFELVLPTVMATGWRRLTVPGHLVGLVERHRIDVVHAHMSDSAVWGVMLQQLTCRPCVITHHSTDLLDSVSHHRWLRQRLLRVCARRAAGNIAVSEMVKRNLMLAADLPAHAVEMLWNAVPAPPERKVEAACAARRARAAAGFGTSKRPKIVYVGRMELVKDLDTVVEAAPEVVRAFPSAQFVLVGDGTLLPSLKAKVHALGIGSHFEFAGTATEVDPFLSDADLYLSASRCEGMSLALLEAMSWGIPVVASDVDGHRELMRAGEAGLLVPSGDSPAFAAAVTTALRERQVTEERVRRARELLREHHQLGEVARRHVELYRRVLGRGAR